MRSTIAVFSALFLVLFFVTGCEREEIEEFVPEDPVIPAITISIESEDTIHVNGETVEMEELADHLERLVREVEEATAQINAAPGVTRELIQQIEEIVYMVDGLELDAEIPDMELM